MAALRGGPRSAPALHRTAEVDRWRDCRRSWHDLPAVESKWLVRYLFDTWSVRTGRKLGFHWSAGL